MGTTRRTHDQRRYPGGLLRPPTPSRLCRSVNGEVGESVCAAMTVIVLTLWFATAAAGQAQAPEPRPASTMQQLMQATIFVNANVVFAAQRDDPATIVRDARPSLSTNPLTGLYGGWQAIENSGLALVDAADLLNVRGRVCSNGRPVPVQEVDWKTAVQTLRESGMAVAAVARARSLDRMDEISDQLTEACSACHRIYRVRDNLWVRLGAVPTAPPR
jgi:hypothetical protein